MKSSVEALEGNKVKVYVEVEEDEFEHDIDRAFRAIAKEVRLPGFRNGKVPRKVLEAHIGLGPAREQAIRDAVPQYLAKALEEHDVDLIATPEVELTDGQESGPVEFDATCEVRPVITVPGYGGLRVELPAIEVDESELEQARAAALRKGGELEDVDRPIERGDYVTIDMVAMRGDEEVPGLNIEDWSYEVGQGWVTDDFDEQLIGAEQGDELTFESTPKETQEPAEFTVTISSVQAMAAADLTDEWVQDNLGEFDTVEEWNASLAESLQQTKLNMARQQLSGRLSESLIGLTDVEPPAAMVDGELNQRVQGTIQQFQAQGIDFEQWLQATGQDPEQFVESMRGQAEQSAKVDLALRAVADAEVLDVEGDELEAQYAMLAMRHGQKAKDIRKLYEKNNAVPGLVADIRKSKAFDFLLQNAEFVDTEGRPIDRDVLLGRDRNDEGDHDDGDDVVDALIEDDPPTESEEDAES